MVAAGRYQERAHERLRGNKLEGVIQQPVIVGVRPRQRRYPDAIAELGKASSLAPGNPRYAYVYAVALDSAGKPDPALRVLWEAYHRHPYDREVLLGLASILRDRGRAKEATRYAEELVAVMPESAEAKRLLEEIRAKGGR